MSSNTDQPKIYVAGHSGMVGSAIVRILEKMGNTRFVTRTHAELDLTDQAEVRDFFEQEKPDQVYLAAAKVGGIHANNSYPAEFIYENLMIEANVIDAAFRSCVKKLLFLGSSCIYPKLANQPMQEEALMTGALEPTNEPYAIAKIAGIKMCESYNRQYGKSHNIDYRCIMPTNLYGIGDSYHPENSHVIPGLIYRFHKAKISESPNVTIWGSGKPIREFIHVDDLAEAVFTVLNTKNSHFKNIMNDKMPILNVGSGESLSIKKLAYLIKKLVDFKGKIIFDKSYPDGTFKKNLNSKRIKSLNWAPKIKLSKGLKKIIDQRNTY